MSPTALNDIEYHRLAGQALAAIESTVDRWLQDDVIDIDAARTGGMLELALPGGSRIVVNTQPPLHELWVAARAGGYHFKWVEGAWVEREGHEFFELLSRLASEQAGQALRFDPPSV